MSTAVALAIGVLVAAPQARAAVDAPPPVDADTVSESDTETPAPRLWSVMVGAGVAGLSEGGGGYGFAVDLAVRPWGRSGIGARLDAAAAGATMLGSGAVYENFLVTAGYAYQLPIGRDTVTGSSLDFLIGPMLGVSRRSWNEGLCLDFNGNGCDSSRPEGFEPDERFVTGVGGAMSVNLHLWSVVLGPYASVGGGLADDEAFLQFQAGLRIGASDW